MKTVFICKSMNLRLERVDHKIYRVTDHINIKYQGRWLTLIVEDIREVNGVRQVLLRVGKVLPHSHHSTKSIATLPHPFPDGGWIEDFLSAIEGKSGRVFW